MTRFTHQFYHLGTAPWLRAVIMFAGSIGMGNALAANAPAPTLRLQAYFISEASEQADLEACAAEADALKAHALSKAGDLLDLLTRSDALNLRLRRHLEYGKILTLQDIENQPARAARAKARRIYSGYNTWLNNVLAQYDEQRFLKEAQDLPALRAFSYLMQDVRLTQTHTLAEEQQSMLDSLARPTQDRYWLMYQHLEKTAPFGTVETAQGPLPVGANFKNLLQEKDRGLRQRAWEQYWHAYATLEDIYADVVLGVVQLEDQRERLLRYPDAPTARYSMRGLATADVQAAFEQVRAHAALLRRYHAARNGQLAKTLGIGDPQPWDALVGTGTAPNQRWSLDAARAAGLAAVAPLGKDYQRHMQALLDPANGRSDIAFDKGRRASDSTSISAPGVPSGLFVETFLGTPASVETLIHEGGHSIHSQYMSEAQVPEFYLSGPSWMREAIATLNSFLVHEYMAANAATTEQKIQYQEIFMQKLNFELFEAAQEGILEQRIYTQARAGKLNNASQLNALGLEVWGEFDAMAARHPEIGRVWMSKRLFVNDPLYLFNYLYSGALASKMFTMVKKDPADFERRFPPLLRDGFGAPPMQILEKFFGHPISHAELIDDAMGFYQQQLQQLESLYSTR